MINYILSSLIILSCGYAFFSGGIDSLTNAVITSGSSAVSLMLTILGSMATWGGVMRLAQTSGLTDKITLLIKPFLKIVFRGWTAAPTPSRQLP